MTYQYLTVDMIDAYRKRKICDVFFIYGLKVVNLTNCLILILKIVRLIVTIISISIIIIIIVIINIIITIIFFISSKF